MEMRSFGSLTQSVSAVGFGSASISGEGGGYGFGNISTQDAISLLHKAFEYGINLFDTAPIYGFGLSEQRIGKAFKGRRDDVVLVSKSGLTWDIDQKTGIDNSPATTQKMLEQSLRDLQTDYIDIYMVHWPDSNVDIRRPIEVLAQAKEEGKIKAIGLSNTHPEDIEKAQEIAPINVIQGEFNAFQRHAKEALFAIIRKQSMGFMSYGTLDKGILTGRVTRKAREFDPSDVRSRASWWIGQDREPKFKVMDAILPILKDAGHTGLEYALAFILQHEEVSTALCGSRSIAQLESTLEALSNLPSSELLQEIEEHMTLSAS